MTTALMMTIYAKAKQIYSKEPDVHSAMVGPTLTYRMAPSTSPSRFQVNKVLLITFCPWVHTITNQTYVLVYLLCNTISSYASKFQNNVQEKWSQGQGGGPSQFVVPVLMVTAFLRINVMDQLVKSHFYLVVFQWLFLQLKFLKFVLRWDKTLLRSM